MAVIVVTATVFSSMDRLVVDPPPFDVITGCSFTSRTETEIVCVSVKLPDPLSVTVIPTTYVLSELESVGFS